MTMRAELSLFEKVIGMLWRAASELIKKFSMPNSMERHCGCFTDRCVKQDGWMRGEPQHLPIHPSIHCLSRRSLGNKTI